MATAESVELGPPHFPKEGSLHAFTQLLPEIKRKLITMRHKHIKHDKHYFSEVAHLSDHELTEFGPDNFEEVRVGSSAYGIHILGKVRLPKVENSYIHVRMFVAEEDGEKVYRLHSIYLDKDGHVVLPKERELEWFNE